MLEEKAFPAIDEERGYPSDKSSTRGGSDRESGECEEGADDDGDGDVHD
jgi:hypothetical protein